MRKLLLSLVALLAVTLPSLAQTKTYELCTNLSEINNPNNEFLIVSRHPLNGVIYALPSATTATNFTGVNILEAETLPTRIDVDVTELNLGLFSIKALDTFGILYESKAKKYWGSSAAASNYSTGITNTGLLPSAASTKPTYQLTTVLLKEEGNEMHSK